MRPTIYIPRLPPFSRTRPEAPRLPEPEPKPRYECTRPESAAA